MRSHPHPHFRKRLEPYPAKNRWMRFLDSLVLFAGIVSPLFTIPQIVLIYSTRDATGVSALSWGIFALLDIPWILYGFAHRERPIVYAYVLWLTMNTAVCVGALIYD